MRLINIKLVLFSIFNAGLIAVNVALLNNDSPKEGEADQETTVVEPADLKNKENSDSTLSDEEKNTPKEKMGTATFTPTPIKQVQFKSNEYKRQQALQKEDIRRKNNLIAQKNREIAALQVRNQQLHSEKIALQQQVDESAIKIVALQKSNQQLTEKSENIEQKSDVEKMKERIALQPKNDRKKNKNVIEKEDQDKEEPSNFSGLTEFGFTDEKDNKKTQTIKGRLMLDYTEKDKYSLNTDYEFEFKTEDSVQTTNKYRWQTQADYNLSPISSVFLRADLNRSKYSSYDKEDIYAVGYGRDLYKSKTQNLHFEVGPGYRQSDPNVGKDAVTVNEVITRVRVQYDHVISETLALKLDAVTEIGDKNNIYTSSFSMQKNIYRQLYLVYKFEYKYTENVPADTDQDEISSALKLLYAF